MKFIIPIQNLEIDYLSMVGNYIFVPKNFFTHFSDSNFITEENIQEINNIRDLLSICKHTYNEIYSDYVVAVFDYEFENSKFESNIPQNEFIFLENLCYKVDRALDCLRINKCSFNVREYLTGIPGIIGGYQKGVVINEIENTYRELLGNVVRIYSTPGIGLYEENINVDYGSEDYEIFFSDRDDEVYKACRYALTRINEAFYFNNVNISFIYLMSTLEMITSKDYTPFTKVKQRILSFYVTNKNGFYSESEKLKMISKQIRTEVIHNGKTLYDVLNDEISIVSLLNYLVRLIYICSTEIIKSHILTYEELHLEMDRRISLLIK